MKNIFKLVTVAALISAPVAFADHHDKKGKECHCEKEGHKECDCGKDCKDGKCKHKDDHAKDAKKDEAKH